MRKNKRPNWQPLIDLLQVIRKYVAVDPDAISVQVEHEGNQEILELNIVLPEA